jgi:hypothetical protein
MFATGYTAYLHIPTIQRNTLANGNATGGAGAGPAPARRRSPAQLAGKGRRLTGAFRSEFFFALHFVVVNICCLSVLLPFSFLVRLLVCSSSFACHGPLPGIVGTWIPSENVVDWLEYSD